VSDNDIYLNQIEDKDKLITDLQERLSITDSEKEKLKIKIISMKNYVSKELHDELFNK